MNKQIKSDYDYVKVMDMLRKAKSKSNKPKQGTKQLTSAYNG